MPLSPRSLSTFLAFAQDKAEGGSCYMLGSGTRGVSAMLLRVNEKKPPPEGSGFCRTDLSAQRHLSWQGHLT